MEIFWNLIRLLAISKDEFYVIVTYGVVVGILSLVVPIAAQGLVTIVSFGTVIQPLIILATILCILLICANFLKLLQTILVENIQQKLFARVALTLATRLNQISMSELDEYRGTELVNRFFDIVIVQKNIGVILLNATGILIQAFFGLILLAIYHPALLVFDIIFLCSLAFVTILPFKKALASSLKESDAKFAVAGWLEEIVRIPTLFKFNGYNRFSFNEEDHQVFDYLKARQSHFKQLLKHIIGTYLIQIIASTSLLVLGGLLVINNQMTLGQLVAAEIIVTSLTTSVSRLGGTLESIYDLLCASEKVNFLLSRKTEAILQMPHPENKDLALLPPSIRVVDLQLQNKKLDNSNKRLTFTINAGEHAIIIGEKGAGKSLLIDCLLGLSMHEDSLIYYNDVLLKEYNIQNLRKHIHFIRGIQFFDGSVLDNLTLGNKNIQRPEIDALFVQFNLIDTMKKLPQGLKTTLYGLQKGLSSIELQKLMFIRAILSQPLLLVIDEALDSLPEKDVALVLGILMNPMYSWTLIATTRREDIAKYFNHRICL
jgi:putative ABC transport system ATP-binding protein